jgi:hypothetical protein
MPITLVAALLLTEAVIIVAALIVVYRLQTRPRSRTTIATQRRDAPGWVYEFIDPDSGNTVYVGRGVNVEKRVDQHLRAAMTTGLFYMWIADQIQNGKRPIVRVVAHGNNRNELALLERERISMHIASGCKLFNRQKEAPQSRLAQYVTIEKLED